MKRLYIILSLMLFSMLMVFALSNTVSIEGDSNKYLSEIKGNKVSEGTNGGVTWEFYDNGHLLFKPTNEVEGTFDNFNFGIASLNEWHAYRLQAKTISFESGIKAGDSIAFMFYNFVNVTSVDFSDFDTSNTKNMMSVFSGMESLTDINFGSNFDTSKVTNFSYMFWYNFSMEKYDLGPKFVVSSSSNTTSMFRNNSNPKEIKVPEGFRFNPNMSLESPDKDDNYTGRWMKKEDPTVVYTHSRLLSNPKDINATWVWDTKTIEVKRDIRFENGYYALPDEIVFMLYKGGVDTLERITVKREDIDKYTGIASVNFGFKDKYTNLEETILENYEVDVKYYIENVHLITKTHYKYIPPKMDIIIENNWVNGSRLIPDSIDIKLKRNGEDFKDLTLTKENDWSVIVTELDKASLDGREYTYEIEDVTNIEGFTGKVNNFEITNTYTSPTMDFTDTVIINGGINLLPDPLTVELYKDVKPSGESRDISKQEFIDSNYSKEVTFENVDKTDIEGNPHEYDVRFSERNMLPEGFSIDNLGNLNYASKKADIEADVKYSGGDPLRKSIKITLKREVNGSVETVRETDVNPNDFNDEGIVTLAYDNMDITNVDGEDYRYFIEGSDVNHFKKEKTDMSIKYIYEEELEDITANLIFSGGMNSEKPDKINVKLKNGDVLVSEKDVNIDDNNVVFENIPVRDSNNYEKIRYTLEASDITNFDLSVDNDNNTITYTYVIPKGDVTFPAVKDGGKPLDVSVKLYKDGEYTGDKLNISSDIAPIFHDQELTDNDGNNIKYTVKIDRGSITLPEGYTIEEDEEGNDIIIYNSPRISYTGNVKRIGGKEIDLFVMLTRDGRIYESDIKKIKSGHSATWDDLEKTDRDGNEYTYDISIYYYTEIPEGYSVTRTEDGTLAILYTSPKQMIEITKNWVNGEDVRPDSIKVKLKQNGKDMKEITLTKEDHEVKDDKWVIEFEVDKTDSNADDYTYSVEEILVDDFAPDYSEGGLSITNTYVIPVDSIEAEVVFASGSDRPVITVQLKDDKGTVVDEKYAIKKNGKLIATFEDIAQNNVDGSKIKYTVNSKEVPKNYNEVVSGNVITLTYTPPKINVDIPVNIPSEYNGDVITELIKDGNPTGVTIAKTSDEIREESNKVTFKNVDKTDSNGKDYLYTGDVNINIKGYDKKKDESGNTKFIYTGNPKDIDINANYIGGSLLPREDMTVDILANGETVKTVKVNTKNTKVKSMPTYTRAGEKISYSAKITNKEKLLKKSFEASEIGPKDLKLEYIIPKADKQFRVIYQGLNGSKAPTVKVTLFKDGKITDKVITLNNGETKLTFKDLDSTDKEGKELKYTVDSLDSIAGYTKKVSNNGRTILIIKDKINSEYIPHAGAKENLTMGIILLALITYARRHLKIFTNTVNPNKFDGFVSFRDR